MNKASNLGTLYLVPVPICETPSPLDELSPRLVRALSNSKYFIVENEKTARRFLSKVISQQALDTATFSVLDEHTRPGDIASLLEPILNGNDASIISEAGSPCIADPGHELVAAAFEHGIIAVPIAGPNSIVLALMASGLPGQRFAFNGYLPANRPEREKALRNLESKSALEKSTQIFIETPYRNDAMLESILRVLKANSILCCASGISSEEEKITRQRIYEWRHSKYKIGKVPTVFLILGNHRL